MNFRILAQGATHLIIKRYAGSFWIRRQWLKKTQWLSESELKKIQLVLLKRLVRHCYNTVPYYKTLMDQHGISVDSIKVLEDISLFPILTKNDVLKAGNSLVSTKYPSWSLHCATTGGTTGTSLLVRRDLFSIGNNHAFLQRQFDWAGIGLRDRCAYLTWRAVTPPNQKTKTPYAYDSFMKELILSTYHLSSDIVEKYIEAMDSYKVKALVAYPSAAYVLAKSCLDKGKYLPLTAVLTSSETLDETKREAISEAFQCKIYDFYGSAERTCDIHTCEHGTYHVIPEYGITEFHPLSLPDKKYHKIIATGFWNMAMPLIRYDIGDIIEIGQGTCPCGRIFPVVKRILGRESNFFTTTSGRMMGRTAMGRLFKNVLIGLRNMPVLEGQLVLDTDSSIIFTYVPLRQLSEPEMSKLRALLRRELPLEMRVSIREVKKIKRTPSGKFISMATSEIQVR